MPKRLLTFEVEYDLPIHPPVADSVFVESFVRAIEGLEGRTYSLVTVKNCKHVEAPSEKPPRKGKNDA